ncbi:Protein of unknown function [Mycolicibacterium rutilum]|uniref:DUF4012 domain-containing protein n=1 Tax=Mycolicibacterium rutilum TaxID=370526 RepID=A0A1H6IJ01_MYCRU|nr:DUF4012 domain-containing protein [Mycolicibacterium rutilum]SEH46313.1 Protein of unknown function [Mycolicibacterium rutilum]
MFGCWLAFEAFTAKSNLEQARSAVTGARESLLKGDSAATARWVDRAESHANKARIATHSLPWNIAAVIPWVGSPLKTGQQIADVVQGLATNVMQPAADIAEVLSPDRLLQDGRIDVQLLRESAPRLNTISRSAAELERQARAISEPAYLAVLADARTQLQEQSANVTGLLKYTDLAAQLAPSMMGAEGPRSYFMAFQTNAEARGTGGMLGGFGILRLDDGKPTVDKLGPNTELAGSSSSLNLGPEFSSQYGFANPFTDFRNSNFSAHFPYAAEIWRSMWAELSGTEVDGVVAIDPVALSYILGAVGPVIMPDGEEITQDNVVELTESSVYSRFPTDQGARKQYLQDIASEVVKKTTGEVKSPRLLLDALGKAVSEGRIAVWSASTTNQALLEQTPLAHVIPDDAAPYAGIVINNLGGNKLDYYLRREIEYAADGCRGDTRESTVTVRLSNTAPDAPLPEYVASIGGLPPGLATNIPPGTNVTSVSLVATTGAKLKGAVANGEKIPVFTGTDRGHPVFEVQVAIPRGQSIDVKYLLSEPTTPGIPRVPIQPLVDAVEPNMSVPQC